MSKKCMICLRLPEDLYLKIESESRKQGKKLAEIAREKVIKSIQKDVENDREVVLEKRLEALENAVQIQLKLISRMDNAMAVLVGAK